MTRQEFEDLVGRLEGVAATQTSSYRSKVVLLAAAGYLYIFLVLACLIALLVLLLAAAFSGGGGGWFAKPGIALGAIALAVLRALWVRWPAPEGIALNPDQAPRLFAEVEAIRAKLRAPRVHRVFVDESYNAAMEQRPRLGILGWPEGLMHVGLPLMNALSLEEFRAVLAHELGHLSGNHGRVTGWIYRIRRTWMRLLQGLEEERRWGAGLFTRFFRWYAPFLNAYSFVLARAQEYEADRCAAEVAGKETTARALMAVEVRGKFFSEEFWPNLWKAAALSDRPPADPYVRQRVSLIEEFSEERLHRWVRQSLSVKTGYVDTHPSLADRLKALGFNIQNLNWSSGIDSISKPSAAEELLGPNLDYWYQQFDKRWTSAAGSAWKARHEELRKLSERLADLRSKNAEGSLDEEMSWELARLTNDLEGDDAALPLLRELVRTAPGHVSANFELGRILLGQADSSGMAFLERAMEDDPNCTIHACAFVEQFLREQDRTADADRYHQRALEFADLNDKASEERSNVTQGDTFVEHGLDSEALSRTQEHLQGYKGLKKAFIVRKVVQFLPERPAYVLGIIPDIPWYRPAKTGADLELLNLIAEQAPLPPGTYVILLNRNRNLRKKIEAIRAACVHG